MTICQGYCKENCWSGKEFEFVTFKVHSNTGSVMVTLEKTYSAIASFLDLSFPFVHHRIIHREGRKEPQVHLLISSGDTDIENRLWTQRGGDIKKLFSSSSLSAIRLVSSAYLRLLIFLPAILIPAWASSSLAFRMTYSAPTSLRIMLFKVQPYCSIYQSVIPFYNWAISYCTHFIYLLIMW